MAKSGDLAKRMGAKLKGDGRAIDSDDLSKRMGAQLRGNLDVGHGYLRALHLADEVQRRFVKPRYGGRAYDPTMTKLRNIRLTPEALKKLEELAQHLGEQGTRVGPLQIASLLLDMVINNMGDNPEWICALKDRS